MGQMKKHIAHWPLSAKPHAGVGVTALTYLPSSKDEHRFATAGNDVSRRM